MNKFVLLSSVMLLTACGTPKSTEDPDYWQRISASEAAHIRGTNAQSILNRDIAHCVTELKELNRLGELSSPKPELKGIERIKLPFPERENHILDNHESYDEFEECMGNNGWERAMTLNKNTVHRAQDSYTRNHAKKGDKYHGKRALGLDKGSKENDFEDLND